MDFIKPRQSLKIGNGIREQVSRRESVDRKSIKMGGNHHGERGIEL